MGNLKNLVLAGAAVFASAPAFAADLPIVPRPPMQVANDFGGSWYLRGDIGVGAQTFDNFAVHPTNPAFVFPASWRMDQKDIKDTTFIGFGIGYQFNSWLRFDATGEYRADVKLKALGSYTEFCPIVGGRCFDLYDGDHQAWVFLANAYIDLGTWWCLTPFVGAGVGAAHHNIAALTDVGVNTGGFGYASEDRSSWTLAWAVHAGLAYNVTNTFKIELAYRYLNMGSPDSAIINCAATGCATAGARAYYSLTDFTSQDIKLGFRWLFNDAPAYQPPIIRKG